MFTGITRLLNQWNNQIEKGETALINAATVCLPHRGRKIINEEYLTQAQLITHGLFTGILIQATIANPYLPPVASYILAGGGFLATSKPFLGYLKRHLIQISSLSTSKKLSCVAFPILLGGVQAGTLYATGFYSEEKKEEVISMSPLLAFVDYTASIVVHAVQISLHKKDKNSDEEAVRIESSESFHSIEKEVNQLEEMMAKVNAFMRENPTFMQECSQYLKEVEGDIGLYTPPDVSDADMEAQLKIKKITLEHNLSAVMLFMKRYPDLLSSFEKIVQEKQRNFEQLPLLESR